MLKKLKISSRQSAKQFSFYKRNTFARINKKTRRNNKHDRIEDNSICKESMIALAEVIYILMIFMTFKYSASISQA